MVARIAVYCCILLPSAFPALGATFAVTNVADHGAGSLRQAVLDANAHAGADSITFAIGTGARTISPGSALPAVTDSLLIDGTTQPGFAGTPLIELDGTSAGPIADGFTVIASHCTVRGLAFQRFAEFAIRATGVSNLTVEGNWIGLDATGTNAPGATSGILLNVCEACRIGGTTSSSRNVFAGCVAWPILIGGGFSNRVEGNYVGLDATGARVRGNGYGVYLNDPTNCIVGGSDPAARNVICGSTWDGVSMVGGSGNRVLGNFIGTDFTGALDFGNGRHGIFMTYVARNHQIGGAGAGEGNLISGNDGSGIHMERSTGARLRGNRIGIDASGTVAISNTVDGIFMDNDLADQPGHYVGGASPGARNIVSGNGRHGIRIQGVGATTNLVAGNFIGTDVTGTLPLGNGGDGVSLDFYPNFTLIGGTDAGAGNGIAFNGGYGVLIGYFCGQDPIRANSIHSNGREGILLAGIANASQPAPALTNVLITPTQSWISGVATGPLNTMLALEIFASYACDPTGAGEGQFLLLTTNVLTDAAGRSEFQVILPYPLPARFVTATATDPGNNTSGFSLCAPVISTIPGETLTVLNTDDSGPGSLRQAILTANTSVTERTTIEFNIPGAGVHPIWLLSDLPPIVTPVIIDGFSQPGSRPNTMLVGDDAARPIRLDGLDAARRGLLFQSDSNVVRGLNLTRFFDYAIRLRSSGNVVEGNLIGLDEAGALAGNSGDGIEVPGHFNRIGGTTRAARNIVSGHSFLGLRLGSDSSLSWGSNNVIQGNYIGTDPTGKSRRPNAGGGISLSGASGTLIGGAGPGEANVISGNQLGLFIVNNSISNRVFGNLIGVDAAGTAALSNTTYGVLFDFSAPFNNFVGGTAPGQGNVIAFNGAAGVGLFDGSGNSVRGNSIYDNGQLGLDVGPTSGVTANDSGDADTGPNTVQNFPILSNVVATATNFTITGSLNSQTNTSYVIDFYANAACDPSGHGEGATHLGFITVTTDGNGLASFAQAFSGLIAGPLVTATATTTNGSTSEFSPCLAITRRGPIATFTVINPNDSGPGSFRQALLEANAHFANERNLIHFSSPAPATYWIRPLSPLPEILNPITIDGYTMPGAAANTDLAIFNGTVRIWIDGSAIPVPFDGLRFLAPSNIVRGLAIAGFLGDQIELVSGHGNRIEGNLIGLRPDLAFTPIGLSGIHVSSPDGLDRRALSEYNVIGGLEPACRNVISGNSNGVRLHNSAGNRVLGNLVGLTPSGLMPHYNFGSGIEILNTSRTQGLQPTNEIGGSVAGARNIIAANGATFGLTTNGHGILGRGTVHLRIQGNYIGTDVTGSKSLPNLQDGISLEGSTAPDAIIGGTAAGAGNLISGHSRYGIRLADSVGEGSGTNRVEGNLIGTDATGTRALPNGTGIYLEESRRNQIGGSPPSAGNVISGNRTGILLQVGQRNVIQGNRIGTDIAGLPLGNFEGIVFRARSNVPTDSMVGGTNAGEGNVIAYNTQRGVWVQDGLRISILGNSILANGQLGIDLGFPPGLTLNDLGDLDSGPNNLQNYPVIAAAYLQSANTIIYGTATTTRTNRLRLEFFHSDQCLELRHGNAAEFLGWIPVQTDASGVAEFTFVVPRLLAGFITATATDSVGNTSELSPCAMITLEHPPVGLMIGAPDGQPLVTWPSGTGGLQLECTESLRPPIEWRAVTSGIVNNGMTKRFVITNASDAITRFYRLHNQ